MRILNWVRGRDLKARITQPADEWWDRRLGVSTFGHHPGCHGRSDREWFMHYIPSTYRDVFGTLRFAGIARDDVVTDVGSGLGRVVFAASWLGAKRAEGVERVEWLVEAAEANRRRSRLGTRDIAFLCGDARVHDFARTTLLYLFHPFSDSVVADVLAKVRADRSAADASHRLRIAYVNPVADPTLAGSGWLRHMETLPARPCRFSSADHYPTSLWHSID